MHNKIVVHIYTTEYYLVVKKNEMMNFSDKWIEQKKRHIEGSNADTLRQISYSLSSEAHNSKFSNFQI